MASKNLSRSFGFVCLASILASCSKTSSDDPPIKLLSVPVVNRPAKAGNAPEMIPLAAMATIKGRVVYDGDPPEPADLTPLLKKRREDQHCIEGAPKDPLWKIGADQRVANVVVWLRAPKGKYFEIPASAKQRNETIVMDTIFCQYDPHVVVFQPSFWDPQTKNQVKNGQTLKVVNSSPIAQCVVWKGDNTVVNVGDNKIIPPKKDGQVSSCEVHAMPCRAREIGGEDLLYFSCDVRAWMNARVVVLDHPFFALTDERGHFEIKNAPAGVPVILTHWHESLGSLKEAKTETVTLKADDNIKYFKIKQEK